MWNAKKYRTYYEILKLPEDCSAEDIQKAYLKLVQLYHPDKNVGKEYSHEQFVNIREAYTILKNPQKRKEYNSWLSNKCYREFDKYDNYYKTHGYKMNFSESFSSSGSSEKFRNSLVFRLILMPKMLLITTFLIVALLASGQHMFLFWNNDRKRMTLRDNSFMTSLIYEDAKRRGQHMGVDERIRRMQEGTLESVDPQKLLDEYIEKTSQKRQHK